MGLSILIKTILCCSFTYDLPCRPNLQCASSSAEIIKAVRMHLQVFATSALGRSACHTGASHHALKVEVHLFCELLVSFPHTSLVAMLSGIMIA